MFKYLKKIIFLEFWFLKIQKKMDFWVWIWVWIWIFLDFWVWIWVWILDFLDFWIWIWVWVSHPNPIQKPNFFWVRTSGQHSKLDKDSILVRFLFYPNVKDTKSDPFFSINFWENNLMEIRIKLVSLLYICACNWYT